MNVRPARPPMGFATENTAENKRIYKRLLDSFDGSDVSTIKQVAQTAFLPNAQIDAAHPINEAKGGEGYFNEIIAPWPVVYETFSDAMTY